MLYPEPPPVTKPYEASNALEDIPGLHYALEQFLASQMVESETYIKESDPKMERMYFSTGFGLIQCVKAFMSYEDSDILAGITHTKRGNQIAQQHRKKAKLTSYLWSNTSWIKSMTAVERHAELTYAESLFEKALLGIVYSGDWLAFIKEALNMRTIINIYRNLFKFIEAADKEHPDGEDPSIDQHFRSGVYLGMGLSTLILSMIPAKLLTIVELFGYKGDRHEALSILMRAGGWSKERGVDEPTMETEHEGIRRSICDMALLVFHLVLSGFTFEGVDVSVADKITKWNLERFGGRGVFFLFAAGRLSLVRSQPKEALDYYERAIQAQNQYRNLHHISFWESAIANMALWDLHASLNNWRGLEAEATWSKAIYTYGVAVCLLQSNPDEKARTEAVELIERVPNLRQKIAGKSIPLEKFVARKARKFLSQKNRLLLPALELAYLFLAIAHAPMSVLLEKMLPEIERGMGELKEGQTGYWDDMCLALFLKGVVQRYAAFPDPDAAVKEGEPERAKDAEECFRKVFEYGPKIELDHWLVYHAHYELGRLLACLEKPDEATAQFELVLSGKYLEVGPSGRKGKYSLENALTMRTHAALEGLHEKRL